jgi:Phasin protein
MTSSRTNKTRPGDMFAVHYDDAEVRRVALQQAETFWRAQERALDHLDTMIQEWLNRRRQGTQAALEAAQKLCGCKDPNEASSVYGAWMTGSAERLADDARAFSERMMRMMQDLAEAASAPSANAAADKSAETQPEKPADAPAVKLARSA